MGLANHSTKQASKSRPSAIARDRISRSSSGATICRTDTAKVYSTRSLSTLLLSQGFNLMQLDKKLLGDGIYNTTPLPGRTQSERTLIVGDTRTSTSKGKLSKSLPRYVNPFETLERTLRLDDVPNAYTAISTATQTPKTSSPASETDAGFESTGDLATTGSPDSSTSPEVSENQTEPSPVDESPFQVHDGRDASETLRSVPASDNVPANLTDDEIILVKKRRAKAVAKVQDLAWEIPLPELRQALYSGSALYGKIPHGVGTLTMENGDSYEGPFNGGQMHGSNATFKSSDGAVYVGDFHLNLKHGSGTEDISDGTRYVGRYRHDLRHGFGILFDARGNILQGGVWKDGAFVAGGSNIANAVETDEISVSYSTASEDSDQESNYQPFSIYDDLAVPSPHRPIDDHDDDYVPIAYDTPMSSSSRKNMRSRRFFDISNNIPLLGISK